MGRWGRMMAGLMGMLVVGGCVHAQAKITQMPRVDLQVSGGNRGYLVGTPPADTGPQKTMRERFGADIEIPSFYKPKHTGAGANLDEMAPPETETDEAAGSEEGTTPSHYDTYVVQKGDSLWSIAAKPEIYGKASMWRRIFDANRDVLKSPDRVRPGMTLKIPRGDDGGESVTFDDEDRTWKK